MFKSYFKTITLLSVAFFSSFSFAADAPNNLFAVGSYDTHIIDPHRYPWIFSSSDQGQTWSYLTNKPNETVHNVRLLSSSCNGNNCVAVGYYDYEDKYSAMPVNYPTVAMSYNHGQSWVYTPIESSGLRIKTSPSDVSCNNQLCAMVGIDESGSRMISTLAVSRDNGSTWSYPDIKNLPWDYKYNNSVLEKIDCTTGNCVATGWYRKPFLIVSSNQGKEWTYYDVPFPIEPIQFEIKNIKCHDSTCVIGGYYQSIYNFPFLIKSNDKGKSWSYMKFPYEIKGGINNVDCHGNECLASGRFYINKDVFYRIAVSHDGGLSWSYPKIKAPNGGELDGVLDIVAINDDNYIVAGAEYRYLGDAPILMVSKDRGETWNYVNSITPKDLREGDLSNIWCQKNICLAIGSYAKNHERDSCVSCPYLMISYNSGQDWSLPPDVISKLPKDYYMNGTFNRAS